MVTIPGSLSAPQGNIGLFAGKEVLINDRPDGRGLSAAVRLPEGSVANDGKITADAGTVALHAQVVNQNGLIQADSVRNVNGVIELVASDTVHLGAKSLIQAQGGANAAGNGGQIIMGIPALDLVFAHFGGNYQDDVMFQVQRKIIPEWVLPAVVK